MFYSEKEAKRFLGRRGFKIQKSIYITNKNKINSIKNLKFPLAVKICGKTIVHKTKIGGVKLNIMSLKEVHKAFEELKKLKGFEGVTIQQQIFGKEVFIGVKKTMEFGHVIGFGSGGIDIEEKKDVAFRVFPLTKVDIENLINETLISKNLIQKEIFFIKRNLFKLNKLILKNPRIMELDINPLCVDKNGAEIIDARIVFED